VDSPRLEQQEKKESRASSRARIVLVALLAAIGLAAFLVSRQPTPHPEEAERSSLEPSGSPRPAPEATKTPRGDLGSLGEIAEGAQLGSFRIESVQGPADGAVRVFARSPTDVVTYEIRLASDAPLPPAKAGLYNIYYRSTDAGPEVLAGATALAELLKKAPPNAPPIRGLTKYPWAPKP
jgi:hypothetical protein